MEIVRHGDPDKLERLKLQFTCPCCACVFRADRTEYEEFAGVDNNYPIQVMRIRCPECGEGCRTEVRYE